MKIQHIILGSAIVLAATSCTVQKPATATISEPKELKKTEMLLGNQSINAFKVAPYSGWYNQEFNGYNMDQNTLAELQKKNFQGYEIITFMGTWCEDSHREFPRFVKILNAINFPESQLTIFAVDRNKTAPNGEEVPYNIHKVPTFIIKKNGKELGRIIEFPTSGFLERDLLNIINKG